MTRHLLAAALLFFALPATAHDYALGALRVDHPVVYAAPPTARAAAGYMTIANSGDTPDRLTGIAIDAGDARAEIHRSAMRDGVMTMEEAGAVEIPAGGEAALAPGGYHVMILGLPAAPREGETIDATLTFERAGKVDVTFHVEARPAAGQEQDHSRH